MIWFLIIAFVDTFLDWTWVSGEIEQWNNPDQKFANPKRPYSGWWYFGIYKPDHHEWFPYSTTLFIWTTDWYHFAKLCRVLALVVLSGLPIKYVIVYGLFSHFVYAALKNTSKNDLYLLLRRVIFKYKRLRRNIRKKIIKFEAMKINDTGADFLTTTSIVASIGAIASAWNPIISAVGGLVAIITGVLGAMYYMRKLKEKKEGDNV